MDNLALLTWLIPVPLFVAFGLMALMAYGGRLPKPTATAIAMTGVLAALVLALIVFASSLRLNLNEQPVGSSFPWLATGDTTFNIGVVVDPLNLPFVFMVSLACTLIFLYSTSYMANDPRYARFMTYLCLFAGSMLGLVVSDNLLTFFVFWELMGFCSYALIGFFYNKPSAFKAAVKAFMTTRIGDMFLMLGIVYLWSATGTLNFHAIMQNEDILEHLVHEPALIFGGLSAATVIGLLIFGGTVGKSAQWPLHVWLPDAMEGPTPVSAMIHAATMVSAGVLLSLRIFPLLNATLAHVPSGMGTAFNVIGFIGAMTALIGALIAVAQFDIKRVLAYSTISQLGFMVAAIGMGAYVAAAFHLLTHAFFKALLFLGSGSVIHGVEHGHHHLAHAAPAGHAEPADDHGHDAHDAHGTDGHDAPSEPEFDAQDMRNMGGLRTRMPVTFITFLIGGLALSGFPFITAGFWSKDEILGAAYQGLTEGQTLHTVIFAVLVFSATLTAFYTMRQIALTFFGVARTEAAANAAENPWQMTLPLGVLSFFALFAGLMNIPRQIPVIGTEWLGNLLEPTLEASIKVIGHEHAAVFSFVPMIVSIVIGLLGLSVGWLIYGAKPLAANQADPVEKLGGLFTFLNRRMLWDELYRAVFIMPLQWIADNYSRIVDKGIIDGILTGGYAIGGRFAGLLKSFDERVVTGTSNKVGEFFRDLGQSGRELQTGRVQEYLVSALIAAVVMLAFFLFIQ